MLPYYSNKSRNLTRIDVQVAIPTEVSILHKYMQHVHNHKQKVYYYRLYNDICRSSTFLRELMALQHITLQSSAMIQHIQQTSIPQKNYLLHFVFTKQIQSASLRLRDYRQQPSQAAMTLLHCSWQ